MLLIYFYITLFLISGVDRPTKCKQCQVCENVLAFVSYICIYFASDFISFGSNKDSLTYTKVV